MLEVAATSETRKLAFVPWNRCTLVMLYCWPYAQSLTGREKVGCFNPWLRYGGMYTLKEINTKKEQSEMVRTYLDAEFLRVPDSSVVVVGLRIGSRNKNATVGQQSSFRVVHASHDGVVQDRKS